jgi:multiple sugar transport system ATP-binding protein
VAQIVFDNVTKVYPDGTLAVAGVDLEIPDGKLAVLVGPSGCGKTTLLRMVAGLEDITAGEIAIGDRIINDVSPRERDIAMVFQNYALYPHMTVFGNMAFGLRLRRTRPELVRERVGRTAGVLALSEFLDKKPKLLSGGQRQRVAMGRAIVRQPQAFLMDEPLSNLDAQLRVQMRAEIARLQHDLGVTTIYVTHDQTEAMTLGDVVAVMRLGLLQQVASPQELYRRPANVFVARFIGSPSMNLVEADLASDGGYVAEFAGARLRLPDDLLAGRPALAAYVGGRVVLGLRPENIEDAELVSDAAEEHCLSAPVELREEMGAETYVHFDVAAQPVEIADVRELAAAADAVVVADLREQASRHTTRFVGRFSPTTQVREGSIARIHVDVSALHYFDPRTGAAIWEQTTSGEAPAVAPAAGS